MTEGNDFLCDAWGNPFCFMLANSDELYKLHPALRRWELPDLLEWNNEVREEDKLYPTIKEGRQIIFFWSTGENKTNEFGYGDDVIMRHIKNKKNEGSKELRLLQKTYLNALSSLKNDIDDSDRNKLIDVECLRFYLGEKGILQSNEKYGETTLFLNPNMKLWFSALEQDEDTKEQKERVKGYSGFAIILESEGYFLGIRFDGSTGAESDMPDVPMWARKGEINNGLKVNE